MKNIQDILRKKMSAKSGEKKELDEKTILGVFLSVAKSMVKNLEAHDIREFKMKNPPASSREASRAGKIIYIKTAHPVVSSELFLRREDILEETNKISGGEVIERMIIS
jgi:hypothetical protein